MIKKTILLVDDEEILLKTIAKDLRTEGYDVTMAANGGCAIAKLEKGKTLESHRDPMEEIYFILSGEGEMTVDQETRIVTPGDAIWIPAGAQHSFTNATEEDCVILVVASPAW